MKHEIEKAAAIMQKSKNVIALTGAGISVESGIPDFRSAGGLWEKYDPAVYASIDTFVKKPAMVWNMIFDMIDVITAATPNAGHKALAELEREGYLKAVITQNIDNLHQRAGSSRVVEFHGNAAFLECIKCGKKISGSEFNLSAKVPPECPVCKRILKPSIVFFGEVIPRTAMSETRQLSDAADAVLVIGTSAVVYPAAAIPINAKRNGAFVIEFNVEPTALTPAVTDIFISGPAGETLPYLLAILKRGG